MRVEVKPELLQWARERAGLSVAALSKRFPRLEAWENRTAQPTLKQLEAYARATHAPVGYFFSPEPPVEEMPIPDFRTIADAGVARPSPDLLDTVYVCQRRQDWYRDFALSEDLDPVPFAGAARVGDDVVRAADAMRHSLGFDLDVRRQLPTWTEALRQFIEQADEIGVLVMVNGIVGNNTHRKLRPDEFRGFALADPLAPLVFIDGADTRAAQMFTLAHELAHIWLGESAISDAGPASTPSNDVETWCNRVAAELLVPAASLREQFRRSAPAREEATRLARVFKVSTLVLLRRFRDIGELGGEQFWREYEDEVAYLRSRERRGRGDFYLTLCTRASRRFARAFVVSTLEGRSSFTEAFRLLGFKKLTTFRNLGHSLGLAGKESLC